ncbi:MAG: YARHG domain-containing protein [Verrucomicrobiota bacterium]
MRKVLPLCASIIFLGTVFSSAEETAEKADSDISAPNAESSVMKGTFVGDFGGKKITICIDRVVGETITGYSIVAGNERAFSGSYQVHEKGFAIAAAEPGDRPDDGVFKLLYTKETDDLGGIWTPNEPKQIKERVFVLPRKVFKYDAKAGTYPQSSSKLLKESDIENMRPEELRIMRNEIYARHGYGFKLVDMREHFEKQGWYMALSQDVTSSLTEKEKKNAALIKRYENYGAEYYDSYGR